MFTLDGVPLLYNGMEAGDTAESGAPALFERLPIFWGNVERRSQFPLLYKQLISLRRDHPALRRGETEWLRNSDEQRVVSFLRRDGNEEVHYNQRRTDRLLALWGGERSQLQTAIPDSVRRSRLRLA